MGELINGILLYSRMGKMDIKPEFIQTGELLENVLELIVVPAGIEIDIASDLPPVTCDRTQLHQIFQNLIGNAIKFVDASGGRIQISCRDVGMFWEFAVQDNGRGIDTKHFEMIFKMLQSVRMPGDKQSTGIGLAIVKKLVEGNGGTVRVQSRVGEGSTFYFTVRKGETATETQAGG